jgi:hypothetical protein
MVVRRIGEAGGRAGKSCRLRRAVSSLDDRAAAAVQCSATRQFPVIWSRSKLQLTERQSQLQCTKQRAAQRREARHNSKSGKQFAERNTAFRQQFPGHRGTAQRSSLSREPVSSKITNGTVGADAVSHRVTYSLQGLSPASSYSVPRRRRRVRFPAGKRAESTIRFRLRKLETPWIRPGFSGSQWVARPAIHRNQGSRVRHQCRWIVGCRQTAG